MKIEEDEKLTFLEIIHDLKSGDEEHAFNKLKEVIKHLETEKENRDN